MTALTNKLARLRADLAAATPGPLKIHDNFAWIVYDSNGTELVDFDGDGLTVAEDNANARAHVGAVNAAPTLLDVVEAAAKRPWWQNVAEVSWRSCRACGAHWQPGQGNPKHGTTQPHGRLCWLSDLDAALDRAEAEGAR